MDTGGYGCDKRIKKPNDQKLPDKFIVFIEYLAN